jgi:hypothetical protein
MGTFPKVPPLFIMKRISSSFVETRTERDDPNKRDGTLRNVPYNNAEKKGMIFSKFQEHGY